MTTQTKKALLIINPAAGSRSAPEVKEAIEKWFDQTQYDFTIYETTGEEDLPKVVSDYLKDDQFDLILAAGGDGTISEVANGVAGSGEPLGIIPVGTSNAIAQELGLPLEIDPVCQIYANNPRKRSFDAILIEGHHYLLHASVGINAQIMNTSRELKNQYGMLAYIWTLVSELRRQPLNTYLLTIDGEDHRVEGIELLLANAAALGIPSLHWGEQIEPDDGIVDVCIVQPQSFADYFRVFLDILLRRPNEDRFINYLKARDTIVVKTGEAEEIDTSGDGEPIDQTPLEAQVVNAYVELLVPG